MSTQVNWEWSLFWSGQEAKIYPLIYLLHIYGGNVNYYKSVHHLIPTLSVGTGNTPTIFKTN